MSDTDKDKPQWVTAEWYEAYHMCGDHHTRWGRYEGSCTLPDEPVRMRENRWKYSRGLGCHWTPVDRPYRNRWSLAHVPRWFIDHVWTAPQRRAARDDSRRAIAEYRATGEVDVIHDTRQARHGAYWMWD